MLSLKNVVVSPESVARPDWKVVTSHNVVVAVFYDVVSSYKSVARLNNNAVQSHKSFARFDRNVVYEGEVRSMKTDRVYALIFAGVYPHYVKKVETKGRTVEELHEVIRWLTGYDQKGLEKVLADRVDLRTFFDEAPKMNPNASQIKGTVCGIRVEDIEDPLMQKIRWMDKLIDELAKGKKMEKILRTAE